MVSLLLEHHADVNPQAKYKSACSIIRRGASVTVALAAKELECVRWANALGLVICVASAARSSQQETSLQAQTSEMRLHDEGPGPGIMGIPLQAPAKFGRLLG